MEESPNAWEEGVHNVEADGRMASHPETFDPEVDDLRRGFHKDITGVIGV